MKIKGVNVNTILDSRKEKTINVFIETNVGRFSASSPNGKSKGKNAVKSYKKSLDEDIKSLKKFSDYFSEENIEEFDDLRRVEDIVDGHVGGNTLFALESAVLKALAKEKKKQVWKIINPGSRKFPRLVGNCIGGGMHSQISECSSAYTLKSTSPKALNSGAHCSVYPKALNSGAKPDFQEFLLIPKSKSVKDSWEMNKKIKKELSLDLKRGDKKFKSEKNDEDAWMTSLNEREVLDLIGKKVPVGLDVAASSFYKRGFYRYANPMLKRNPEEQLEYLSNLIKNFGVFYIEDGFHEEDFDNFAELLKRFPDRLIVGDDLTVTNSKRFEKAIKKKSVNAIIVKPNQCGSLLEVARVCELAKKNKIKLVFSHRSGETEETILADLCFGFGGDFFKCGITGKEREVKLKRLVEIERGFGIL
ncbi:enolase C-terminal domain-like protein [Nanoarchaeota archaeon]